MDPTLSLTLHGTALHPGGLLEGTAVWAGAQPSTQAEVCLIWFTSGKGTRDVQRAASQALPPGPEGRHDFSFTLPAAPYSFSGRLITLTWAVELVLDPDGHSTTAELFLSPDGVEIQLVPLEEPVSTFRWLRSQKP